MILFSASQAQTLQCYFSMQRRVAHLCIYLQRQRYQTACKRLFPLSAVLQSREAFGQTTWHCETRECASRPPDRCWMTPVEECRRCFDVLSIELYIQVALQTNNKTTCQPILVPVFCNIPASSLRLFL
jgi:hypothetical protein